MKSLGGALLLFPFFACACDVLVGLDDDHYLAVPHASTEPNDAGANDEKDAASDANDAAPTLTDAGSDADADVDEDADAAPALTPPTLLASGQQSPGLIRLSGTGVYWINEPYEGKPGAIMKFDMVAGGNPTPVVDGLENPVGLRVYASVVYFTNDRVGADSSKAGLFSVSSNGGAVKVIDNDPGNGYGFGALSLLAQTDDLITEAWSADGGARIRRSVATGPPNSATCYSAPTLGRIPAIDSGTIPVYFVDQGSGDIMMSDLKCNTVAAIFATGQPTAHAFAWDASNIYWLNDDAIMQLPKNTPQGTPVKLATVEKGGLSDYGNDAVYVTDEKAGKVLKVSGGEMDAIAIGQSDPYGIALGNGFVVWSNRGSGEIMMLAQ